MTPALQTDSEGSSSNVLGALKPARVSEQEEIQATEWLFIFGVVFCFITSFLGWIAWRYRNAHWKRPVLWHKVYANNTLAQHPNALQNTGEPALAPCATSPEKLTNNRLHEGLKQAGAPLQSFRQDMLTSPRLRSEAMVKRIYEEREPAN